MSWLRRFIRWLEGPRLSKADYKSLYPRMPDDLEPRPRVGTEITGPPVGAMIRDGILYSPGGSIPDLSKELTYRDPGIVLTGWNGAGVERAFVCSRCGALVAERRTHDEWHAR